MDNSDSQKFKFTDSISHEIQIIDNFKDQTIDFNEVQSKFSNNPVVWTHNASFKHTYSIHWLIDYCRTREVKNLLLFDSDTILNAPIDFIDESYITVADISIYGHYRNCGRERFLPFVQYFNIEMMTACNQPYFDPYRMHGGLTAGTENNNYDTGASFYEDCLVKKFPYAAIDFRTYVTHLGHGSWNELRKQHSKNSQQKV